MIDASAAAAIAEAIWSLPSDSAANVNCIEREANMGKTIDLIGIVCLATVILGAWGWHLWRIAKMRRYNLAWYRAEFPKLVSQDGQATCYSCSGRNLGTERLMQGMYMRRHFCRQCGTTLYYSPER